MSNGRVVSQIIDESRRFDVVLAPRRCRSHDGQGSPRCMIETPLGHVPLRTVADVVETDGPNQMLRENGRRRMVVLANTDGYRHGARWSRQSAPKSPTCSCPTGYFTTPRRHLPGAGGGVAADRRAVAGVAVDDFRRAVQPLQVGRAGADHHGQRAAGADRQRHRAVDRRPAVVRRDHDRLHHADRHQRAQRHPEDQPLHQPGAVRGRDASAGR